MTQNKNVIIFSKAYNNIYIGYQRLLSEIDRMNEEESGEEVWINLSNYVNNLQELCSFYINTLNRRRKRCLLFEPTKFFTYNREYRAFVELYESIVFDFQSLSDEKETEAMASMIKDGANKVIKGFKI